MAVSPYGWRHQLGCPCCKEFAGNIRKYGDVASDPGWGEWLRNHHEELTNSFVQSLATDGSRLYYGGLRAAHSTGGFRSFGALSSGGARLWTADGGGRE